MQCINSFAETSCNFLLNSSEITCSRNVFTNKKMGLTYYKMKSGSIFESGVIWLP